MHIDFLRQKFAEAADADALVWRDQAYSYAYLLEKVNEWNKSLDDAGIATGTVVKLGDHYIRYELVGSLKWTPNSGQADKLRNASESNRNAEVISHAKEAKSSHS